MSVNILMREGKVNKANFVFPLEQVICLKSLCFSSVSKAVTQFFRLKCSPQQALKVAIKKARA